MRSSKATRPSATEIGVQLPTPPHRESNTAAQRHAIDRFAKGLLAFSDDALIDTYHQAMEDLRAARAEGSDNLSKAHAQALATKKAMQERFSDYRTRYKLRYP